MENLTGLLFGRIPISPRRSALATTRCRTNTALVREADNRHDDRAARVEWQGHKLGYIPRLDNAAVSQLLDCGERLEAVIAGLAESGNPWGG